MSENSTTSSSEAMLTIAQILEREVNPVMRAHLLAQQAEIERLQGEIWAMNWEEYVNGVQIPAIPENCLVCMEDGLHQPGFSPTCCGSRVFICMECFCKTFRGKQDHHARYFAYGPDMSNGYTPQCPHCNTILPRRRTSLPTPSLSTPSRPTPSLPTSSMTSNTSTPSTRQSSFTFHHYSPPSIPGEGSMSIETNRRRTRRSTARSQRPVQENPIQGNPIQGNPIQEMSIQEGSVSGILFFLVFIVFILLILFFYI